MPRFFDWTPDDAPAEIFDTSDDAAWDVLRSGYAPNGSAPLDRVIEIAREHGVQSVLIERRYIDADYRSEHARFYSGTFRRYPSVCHRLHFFTESIPVQLSDWGDAQASYVGYSIMRPLDLAPVGRTMISPPPSVAGGTLCSARDTVHLFGTTLEVTAMPFVSQDAQYLRCAHAAEWMVLHHAHLHYGLPRRLPSDIHEAAIGGEVVDRQLPSMGLSMGQMLSSLHSLSLSPGRIVLPPTRAASHVADRLSLPAVMCRYVNSQMPPIVLSESHAWVVVGYRTNGNASGHDSIVLYRHDDAAGPYIEVKDPWNDPEPQHQPWAIALPPLPQKCYLTAERAEVLGELWLETLGTQQTGPMADADGRGDLTYRTYCVPSTTFKEGLAGRGLPNDVKDLYRLAHLPRYVWVVEAIDRSLRDAGQPPVLGEVIIDATAHHLAGAFDLRPMLAIHTGVQALVQTPDFEEIQRVGPLSSAPYESGCPLAAHW